jgi:hypothetical protein
MPQNPPSQASSPESDSDVASSLTLLRIDQGQGALNPAQQTFNRLNEKIGVARAKLQLWEVLTQRLHERLGSEMQPQIAALAQLQRQLISQIDELLTHPPAGARLTRRRRDGLTAFLLDRIDQLLAEANDDGLVALHDHYSDISMKERREVEARLERAFAEQMAGAMFDDDDVGDPAADPVEELFRRMEERLAAEQRAREAHANQRKRSRRETAAQARRAQETEGARLSVREIYRKLVSTLHPDRENDPIERARKTGLMQEINRAYQTNDLLTLLRLQMEIEQINPATLAALPPQRLAHYNEVLREQLRTIQNEIETRIEQLARNLGAPARTRLRDPRDAEQLFNRQMRELRESQSQWRSLLTALADPYRRLQEIDAIARAMAKT